MATSAQRQLEEFCQLVEAGTLAIDVGGFVVPGDESSAFPTSGEEGLTNECRASGSGKETRSAARSWQRSQAEAAASGEAAHAVRTLEAAGVDDWELEGLAHFYPDLRVVAGTSSFVVARMTLGLFTSLPYRASLLLEIPRSPWDTATRPLLSRFEPRRFEADAPVSPTFARVPPVRAWARWHGGVHHGMPVTSHHEYPDGSMCVCMPYEWIRGRDRLLDYVAYCTLWVAKTLHDGERGFYPGLQHAQPWVRLTRSADEYCGCGRRRRYGQCCWNLDRSLTPSHLEMLRRDVHTGYLDALRFQKRWTNPLKVVANFQSTA